YDRSEITQKAVNTMTSALLTGSILVAIILFLFLFELRSAFIVIISLPISLLIAFLMMQSYGISANLMSLSGLAIAIGMIVDGTIVVVENSFRLLQENPKASRAQVIADATAEVAKPVLFALLIIATVFIPLLSLEGLAGKLYTPMALDIVFVMLGSLSVALLLVPVLAYMLLKQGKHVNSPLMSGIKTFYTPMLVFSLQHAKKTVGITFLLFFMLAAFLSQQGREFMPKLNEETIMYRVIAIPGTALTQSVDNAQAIENFIRKTYPNEVNSVLSMIGRSEKGETAQANYMEVLLTLNPDFKEIPRLDKELTAKLKEKFNYLQFISTQPIAMRIEELLAGVSAELAVKIYGEEQKVMSQIASDISGVLKTVEGLDHAEIETQLGQAQINIKPNYLALSRYGLTVENVMQVIRYGIGEEAVTQKIEGIKRFGIVAKLKNAKQDINTLKSLVLRSASGKVVTLEEVCDITTIQGPAFIKRADLSRYMVLSLEVEDRDIATFVEEADAKIRKNVKIPDGYYITWAGDFKNMQTFKAKLKETLAYHNYMIEHYYKAEPVSFDALWAKCERYSKMILPMLADIPNLIATYNAEGKNLMFEGAQGTLLDIDQGTYPYVTSSNTTAGGAASGAGIGPTELDYVLGITKAYATRVGGGPFPTELLYDCDTDKGDPIGKELGTRGHEFGATTGRQRRCGWFDAVALRRSAQINGLTGMCLTKLDVMDELKEIQICVSYEQNGQTLLLPPSSAEEYETCVPNYVTMPGWQTSTVGVASWDALPQAAKDYIRFLEKEVGVAVSILSTGPDRSETLVIADPFA
ncbi:MAG: adenylosuccinate synthetase, partial [Thiomicrorhabdus sp.]|nr:adenylosuccinate synthetase [Thiomicrorhabdus sp.]